MNNLGQRELVTVIKPAGVRRSIKFHGLRHTCATLLLKARTPVHVASERLGHSQGVDDDGDLRARVAGHAATGRDYDWRAVTRLKESHIGAVSKERG